MATDTAEQVTARVQFRRKVRELIGDRPSFKASEIAKEAVAAMVAADPGFLDSFVAELTEQMAYEETLAEIGSTRQASVFDVARPLNSQTDRPVGERLMAFEDWTGERHYRLGDMNRNALRHAAGRRRGRAKRQLLVAGFEEELASGMDNDKITVRERYKASEVESIYQRLVGDAA